MLLLLLLLLALLLPLLSLNLLQLTERQLNGAIKINEVVIEESHEWADLNILDGDAGNDNVVVLVRGQRVLIMLEQVDNPLVKLIEGRVLNLSHFENGGSVIVDVLYLGGITEELTRGGLETAVVPVMEKNQYYRDYRDIDDRSSD